LRMQQRLALSPEMKRKVFVAHPLGTLTRGWGRAPSWARAEAREPGNARADSGLPQQPGPEHPGGAGHARDARLKRLLNLPERAQAQNRSPLGQLQIVCTLSRVPTTHLSTISGEVPVCLESFHTVWRVVRRDDRLRLAYA
jgi:hypothetical protein